MYALLEQPEAACFIYHCVYPFCKCHGLSLLYTSTARKWSKWSVVGSVLINGLLHNILSTLKMCCLAEP